MSQIPQNNQQAHQNQPIGINSNTGYGTGTGLPGMNQQDNNFGNTTDALQHHGTGLATGLGTGINEQIHKKK